MERIGVGFSGELQPSEVVECVRYAEELGYESAWMTEGHGRDQFTILTACALATSRIMLGTSISSVFARSAPTIAIAAACVDEFSKGRFILGLGSSHRVQVVGEHGLAYGKPLTRVRESVDIIRALLQDGLVSYQGDIFNIEGYDLWFTPFCREIPVYLGVVNPGMLALCGQTAQGVILTRSTVERARAAIGHVSAGALGVGRDPSEVELALQLACSVSDNKEEARDRIRGRVAKYAARFPRYRGVMEEAGFTEEGKPCTGAESGARRANRQHVPGRHSRRVSRAHPDIPRRRHYLAYSNAIRGQREGSGAGQGDRSSCTC